MEETPFIPERTPVHINSANFSESKAGEILKEDGENLKFVLSTKSTDDKNLPYKSTETESLKPTSIGVKEQRGLKKHLGILLTLLAAILFSLSSATIKVLSYHPFNLGVWRFFIMILIPIPFLVHAIFVKKQSVFKPLWPISPTFFYLMVRSLLMCLMFKSVSKDDIRSQ